MSCSHTNVRFVQLLKSLKAPTQPQKVIMEINNGETACSHMCRHGQFLNLSFPSYVMAKSEICVHNSHLNLWKNSIYTFTHNK